MILLLTPLLAAFTSLGIRRNTRLLELISVVATFIEGSIVLVTLTQVVNQGGTVLLGFHLTADALGAVLLFVIALIGFAATLYSIGYLREEVAKGIIGFRRVRQYYVLLHLFFLAMFFAVVTDNPIMMWVAIEATTLSTAFLISFYNKPSAMEAAWKYLIINSVGLLLAFFGTLLFLTAAKEVVAIGFVDWGALLAHAGTLNGSLAKLAFLFILVGYGTKVGLAPMHTWLPDAHSKAPAPISALLSGVLLNVAFLAVLRFKLITDVAVGSEFTSKLLIGFGILSLGLAAFMIFGQKNYKRLLAYSSVEHMGIIALGFGFGGIGSFGALLHLIYHSLTKSTLFFSAGNIFLKYSSTKIERIKGVLSVLPVTGVVFLLGFFAIGGIPPFGIFISEFYILSSGILSHPLITLVALFFLVLVFVGLLRKVASMSFGTPTQALPGGEANRWTYAPLIALSVILLFLGFSIPGPLLSLLQAASFLYK